MHEPVARASSNAAPRHGLAEAAGQRAGRDLRERAALDQAGEQAGVALEARRALGMGEQDARSRARWRSATIGSIAAPTGAERALEQHVRRRRRASAPQRLVVELAAAARARSRRRPAAPAGCPRPPAAPRAPRAPATMSAAASPKLASTCDVVAIAACPAATAARASSSRVLRGRRPVVERGEDVGVQVDHRRPIIARPVRLHRNRGEGMFQIDRGGHRRVRDGRQGGRARRSRWPSAVGASIELVSAYEPVPAQRLREEAREAPARPAVDRSTRARTSRRC